MNTRYATVAEIRRTLSNELLEAAGLPQFEALQALLRPLVWLPAHLSARLAAEFDRRVAQSGLAEAVHWVMPRFVDTVRAHGSEQIPAEGPLVIASNHPGSYDAMAIASLVPRDDLKIVVTGRPVFRSMYASARHLIYTPFETHERMSVVRESIRHLREGGAILIFPYGHLEPDPEVLPGADETLQRWSPSLPLFLRRVPETNLLVTIVSGVLAPKCLQHPLTRLRKEPHLQQVLAEIVQISQQMLFGRRFGLAPTVRFASPFRTADLAPGVDGQAILEAITGRAQQLLADVRALPSG
jgi:hypothetical protein